MKTPLVTRMVKSKVFFPLLFGGIALQVNLSGCDPEVRDAILTGFSTSLTTLTTSVISAFFMSLQDATNTTSQPVVQAVFDGLAGLFA